MQFGSDNQTGASEKVLEILDAANAGWTHGYGDDPWCDRAQAALRQVFDCDLQAFFVATGTAANALALSSLVQPWQTVLCHHQAHILVDEATAVEFFTGGARLVPVSRTTGKLTVAHLERYCRLAPAEVPHNARAGALSLTQASENGLVYTPEEIAALAGAARQRGLRVHMDGARFANAVAALGCSPAELSWQAGIDVLCLGATKCGALAAEAVIFFRPDLAEGFTWRRKRAGHLLSKGRFFGAQFVGWLQDGHWLKLARHANEKAARLAAELSAMAGVRIVWPTEANEVFALVPRRLVQHLRSAGAEFYRWYPQALPPGIPVDAEDVFLRLVTSYATGDDEIARLGRLLREMTPSGDRPG